MPRKIIAALVGIAVAVITVMLLEWISHTVFPPPAGVDFNDPDAVNTMMASAPVGALVLVLVGYVMGTFDGVFIACLIARSHPQSFALLIGTLMLTATAYVLTSIEHPTWFSISAIVGIVAAAWLAAKLAPSVRLPGAPNE